MIFQILITAILITASPAAWEDSGASQETSIEDCLICHGKPKLTQFSSAARRALLRKEPGDEARPLKSDDPAFLPKLYVDRSAYLASAHGALQCIECHKDVTLPSHRLGRAAADCMSCHEKAWNDFHASDHLKALQTETPDAPFCYDCHGGYHTMYLRKNPDSPVHADRVLHTCASCHEWYYNTYQNTFHGIFRLLGNRQTAKCISCHENHRILKQDNEESTVHPGRLAGTCKKCHADAGPNFARFRAHLEPLRAVDQPILKGTAWFMRILFFGILGFFGIHTVLWALRSLPDLAFRFRNPGEKSRGAMLRFSMFDRIVHGLIIISFFGLCITGLPLSFAGQTWAQQLVERLGGLESARMLHRIFGGVTTIYAILHLAGLMRLWLKSRQPDNGSLLGPHSLAPRWKDLIDLKDQFRWFFGLGPRPAFGRWTYIEKFDYWAVFWGVFFIGLSGVILMHSAFSTRLLPGWILNWAQIVHREEAMLAMAYIFGIHFFNVHLRPLKLPADPVMFTGRESREHIERERPDLAARLARREIENMPEVKEAGFAANLLSRLIGLVLLAAGVALLVVLVLAWIEKGGL